MRQVSGHIHYRLSDELYLPIKSWADYYLWFTKEYPQLFKFPEIYEFHYKIGNNQEMATYIYGNHYLGNLYSARIGIVFTDDYAAEEFNFERIPTYQRQVVHRRKNLITVIKPEESTSFRPITSWKLETDYSRPTSGRKSSSSSKSKMTSRKIKAQ